MSRRIDVLRVIYGTQCVLAIDLPNADPDNQLGLAHDLIAEVFAAARASLTARDLADQMAADDRLRAALAACEPKETNQPKVTGSHRGNAVGKFRKKPVVIDAIQFTKAMAEGHSPLPEGVHMARRSLAAGGHFPEYANEFPLSNYSTCHCHFIQTLEGRMDVQIGDWVITGVKGERYPCKPDIFAATYEAADTDHNREAVDGLCVEETDDGE